MDLAVDERASDSPFFEKIWRSRSEQTGQFISMAYSHYAMVVAKYRGKTVLTVRGPETKATPAQEHTDIEYFGIRL